MMCVISNNRYVTKRTSFEKLKVVQHNFARFTLGWFVRMTGSKGLFLMVRFVFSYYLFQTYQDHSFQSCTFPLNSIRLFYSLSDRHENWSCCRWTKLSGLDVVGFFIFTLRDEWCALKGAYVDSAFFTPKRAKLWQNKSQTKKSKDVQPCAYILRFVYKKLDSSILIFKKVLLNFVIKLHDLDKRSCTV